ncbi:hypothetical protein GRS48_13525 [Halorubrum sp. JWXQ-INN 858]|uniref:hypothetical protein n=1 Tax=Halorubrum sp. JWXQ-INN 858 TaxID=2690782 RepID=UPI0013587AFB|nr:hypothetical protein [Halorubrum sp. JWXQ-INN 858]MWV65833.1 hypothetical protein [Halorubrum sp. JWXQ-INN 858]
MSLLGRYLAWFNERGTAMQFLSTAGVLGVLFALGVYTAGIAPGVLLVVVLIDHWYRG